MIFIMTPALSAENSMKTEEEQYITLKIPVSSDHFNNIVVAIINGEVITLEDLKSLATPTHEEVFTGKKKEEVDYSQLLKRLINVKLIVEEAKRIGLDELSEVKSLIDTYSRATLRDLFIDELGKNVVVTEEEIDQLYKEVTKQWKVKSILFDKEEDAQRFLEQIREGKDFDELLEKAVTEKIAKGSKEGRFMKTEDLHPPIKEALKKMEIGSVSPIIKVGAEGKEGYTIVKLEEIGYPEDPEKRLKAKEAILASKRINAVKDYKITAYKRYVKINKKIFDSLDFDSKKFDLQKLLKDKRVVANIKGEKPITVATFVEAMRSKFFHGLERAIEGKRVNKKKQEVLEELIDKILFRKEAIKRGIDKTDKYRRMVNEYKDSVLFSFFVRRVIVPDIKINDDDIKAYYDEHINEYTYPEMIKIDKIVLNDKKSAEMAIDKLNKGADFKWVKSNVEGQVSNETEGLLPFQGRFLIRKDLSDDIAKVISGVKPGEARLYESPSGYYYVLYVQDIIPSTFQPIEEVRDMIYRRIYSQRLNKSIEEWSEKLREMADIQVFLLDLKKQE